jgi:hypothetical protein
MFPGWDDPDAVRKPPAEVRVVDLHVEPWPDGRRVRVHLELTPFEQKPNIDLAITSASGEPVATTAIVESMTSKLVITMHLRTLDPSGEYRLEAVVSYPEMDPVDRSTVTFTSLPGAPASG